ncbi:MAG: Serine/threonine exchanger SteT [Planctomycetota bacterium]|jgi:APA family basic amino acid/polyamine antiporter
MSGPAPSPVNPARFGLLTLTCVVVASMIGAGVFTTSGFSLAALSSPQLVLTAWGVGGLIALAGAVAYGELSRRLPVSGGEYLYLSRRLHPLAGFLAGWVSLTAGFSGAIAMAALTFESYLFDGNRPDWLPEKLAAALIIAAFGVGHAFVVRAAASLQNAVVLVKLSVLVVFLLWAASSSSSHPWSWESLPPAKDAQLPTLWMQLLVFAESVMWISLSYAGFNAAVYIASEVRDPERDVPRSLWLGTGVVTILYLLLNLVFVTAAPAAEIAGQERVAAIAAGAIGGPPLQRLIRLAVCLGALSSVAGMVMTGPRVFARMADDGLFPKIFRSGPASTARTVLLQSAISIGLVFWSSLAGLLSYLSALLALSSALTVATLLIPVRGRTSASPQREVSVGIMAAAAFYVLATLATAGMMALRDVRNLAGVAITLAAGLLLWSFIPATGEQQAEAAGDGQGS